MKDLDNATIARLINEAVTGLGAQSIYNASLPYVDFEALKAAQPVSNDDLCATFATAGFAAGIKFALENLEIIDDEKRGGET